MNPSYRKVALLLVIIGLFIAACTKKVIEPEPEPVVPTEPAPELELEEPDSIFYVFGEKKTTTKIKIEKGVPLTLSDADIAQLFGTQIELFTPTAILVTKDSTIITSPETEVRYLSRWKNDDKDLFLVTASGKQELLLGTMVQDSVLQVHVSYSKQSRLLTNRTVYVTDQQFRATPFDVAKHNGDAASHAYGITEELLFRQQPNEEN